MNMKISHFKYYNEKKNQPRKSNLKRVSSAKSIEKSKGEIYRTIDISRFLIEAKVDIIKSRKKPIIKSVLKNSTEKISEKANKIRKIIEQNINREEIMLINDKIDIDYQQIQTFQEKCENQLESLFNEKMKKIFELRQNMSEEIRSSKGTNFDSYDEISFGSIPDKNKELLDSEYDIKFDEIFFQYLRKFNQANNCKKIISIYMRSIYDNLLSKINSVLNPINHKRVKFKSNSSE